MAVPLVLLLPGNRCSSRQQTEGAERWSCVRGRIDLQGSMSDANANEIRITAPITV
jgi:hypothetical protein